MYRKLAADLFLVHSSEEYSFLLNARALDVYGAKPPSGYVKDELELMYPNEIRLLADYPVLVKFATSEDIAPVIIPVAKLIGGLGNIMQLDMRGAFDGLVEACKSSQPFMQPRIMLRSITIRERTSGKTEVFARAVNTIYRKPKSPKVIRIQFGDGKFHGGIEIDPDTEMMFVSQMRDITDAIAFMRMDKSTGMFTADYVFNHYDFIKATPELREYHDMDKWEVMVTVSITSTLKTSKAD